MEVDINVRNIFYNLYNKDTRQEPDHEVQFHSKRFPPLIEPISLFFHWFTTINGLRNMNAPYVDIYSSRFSILKTLFQAVARNSGQKNS